MFFLLKWQYQFDTLVSTLGKNFTDVNNIFTVFGAKFGISNKRQKL